MPKYLRMKIRHRELGGHTHLTFFVNMVPDLEKRYTLGNAGTITLTNEEFGAFKRTIEALPFATFDVGFIEFEKAVST